MVEILDCTLRDGSYVNDFGFTAEFTRQLSRELDDLGFPYIEVGHGVGLGASDKGYGVAACSDAEYMEAAHSPWGMFCIPGIAELEDVRRLIRFGGSFIRIGCEVHKVDAALPFIELARAGGLYVFCNFMKSYCVPRKQFLLDAKESISAGANCIYVVDSAGGMSSRDVYLYVSSVKEYYGGIVQVGFHGHNNIGLGVANAVSACEAGADIIDCSLQGMGRSGGNVPTEQFLAAMASQGMPLCYDIIRVMRMGERLVRPMLRDPGLSSLDIMAGLVQFHSSYMKRLLEVAKENRVDPLNLMREVSSRDKVNVTRELIQRCAEHMDPEDIRYFKEYYGEEQS